MGTRLERIISDAKLLSAKDKALVAHCLISTLDEGSDFNVDDAWACLAEKRCSELDSGEIQAVEWHAIKAKIKAM
ncbi:MAG: addiction module protein [Deltaproteobacteria bacterium]|nr:addiction module protein [Deltaproteobacteria bacterium]